MTDVFGGGICAACNGPVGTGYQVAISGGGTVLFIAGSVCARCANTVRRLLLPEALGEIRETRPMLEGVKPPYTPPRHQRLLGEAR